MSKNYYNDNADSLAKQYFSTSFEEVHASWIQLLPSIIKNKDARILDLGAGSGRDALYLAELLASTHRTAGSHKILAVEPAHQLAAIGRQTTRNAQVTWLNDSLPSLTNVTKQEISFDLILLSAVWMHIPDGERSRSIRKLANLLKPGGKLVISLRYGQTQDDLVQRQMHTVCANELKKLAGDVGLFCALETAKESDKLGRSDVSWQTLVLQMPDDGAGAFPFIRHVALNDGKSATHKLALLRVLLRIADGHPGAVIRRETSALGDRVILPVGLVALYWCHQYKDLIDQHQLFQTPSIRPNMGFMKADGWHKLRHRCASDYRIGNLFTGDDALALYRLISASVSNIKEMPCKHITLPNSNAAIFEVAKKTVKARESIFLDLQTLEQWGEFSLPESTWLALNRYACWIEPVLVSEWVKTMANYRGNAHYKAPEYHHHLYAALNWLEPKRTTTEVRHRFEELKQEQSMHCVWSAKKLGKQYEIDHSLPFSRWPNNDLWNLLPADSSINRQKSDSLPTEQKLKHAKERILQWWQEAWLADNTDKMFTAVVSEASARYTIENSEYSSPLAYTQIANRRRFFAEANIALPGLYAGNQSTDDVFEALIAQRGRLREMQQLSEW